MKRNNISEPVVPRILNYLRISKKLEKENVTTVSSDDLARLTNISACQVRKDLACFGKFGKPRIGYNVSGLKVHLHEIVGGKGTCNLALVGVGNLGEALLDYTGFKNDGLAFVVAFEKNKKKIGKKYGNVVVEDIDRLKKVIKKSNVHIGVIATPINNAQMVADQLIGAGISSILNFAPTLISVPKKVLLRNVDFSNEMKILRFFSVH